MIDTISEKLTSLGHVLPPAAVPVANFIPTVQIAGLVYISGQISVVAGQATHVGRLGADMSVDQGYEAAKVAALNLLSQVASVTDGKLSRVKRIVRVGVFIACTPEFKQQPNVANGASDLLVAVFGNEGRHVRTAVGVAALPAGAAVEIDAIIEIE